MPLYDYLTPKLDFNRNFNHRQSFLYKGLLTVRTNGKFRIGSSLRIESRIGSSIRNRIESRSFAGPYVIVIAKYYMIQCTSTVLLTHTVEPDASVVISEAWFYVAT